MNSVYSELRKGPLLVGEVRGHRAEIVKKFDKSDKNAPPITFGVFKVNLELLSDGSPVLLNIYADQSVDLSKLVVVQRWADHNGTFCVCVMNGFAAVPECFLREPLGVAARFGALRPRMAIAVQADAANSCHSAPAAKLRGAVIC